MKISDLLNEDREESVNFGSKFALAPSIRTDLYPYEKATHMDSHSLTLGSVPDHSEIGVLSCSTSLREKNNISYVLDSPSGVSPLEDSLPRILRPKISPRQYKNNQPSKHCHICRSALDLSNMFPCQNIINRVCRKVVCSKCVSTLNLELVDVAKTTYWHCTHCTGTCPTNATCRTYNRWNSKRASKKK